MSKNVFTFKDNSKEVKRQFHDVSEEAMLAALLFIEGQAKALAPVGNTGELRDKIDHKIVRKQGGNILGQVGSPLQYAIYVEFGTGEFAENGAGRKGGWVYQDPSGQWFFTWGMEPQPFLRPAFRRNRKVVKELIGEHYRFTFKGGINK